MFANVTPSGSALSLAADALAGISFAAPLTLLFVVAQWCTPPHMIATATSLALASRSIGKPCFDFAATLG